MNIRSALSAFSLVLGLAGGDAIAAEESVYLGGGGASVYSETTQSTAGSGSVVFPVQSGASLPLSTAADLAAEAAGFGGVDWRPVYEGADAAQSVSTSVHTAKPPAPVIYAGPARPAPKPAQPAAAAYTAPRYESAQVSAGRDALISVDGVISNRPVYDGEAPRMRPYAEPAAPMTYAQIQPAPEPAPRYAQASPQPRVPYCDPALIGPDCRCTYSRDGEVLKVCSTGSARAETAYAAPSYPVPSQTYAQPHYAAPAPAYQAPAYVAQSYAAPAYAAPAYAPPPVQSYGYSAPTVVYNGVPVSPVARRVIRIRDYCPPGGQVVYRVRTTRRY